jgi:hypothetical protein
MVCPFLRRGHEARCGAVAGAGAPLTRAVVSTSCRGAFEGCPAFRYLRAAGRPAHPGDFMAWVVRGVSPGRILPVPQGFPSF